MFGLSSREVRFGIVISGAHLIQHFFMRLVPPLIPVLSTDLGYPLWQFGLLVSVFSVGSGLGQAPMGVLSDRYDRLYLLPTGIGAAGGCYILFAIAPAIGTVIPTLSVLGYTFEGGFLVMCLSMLICGIGSAVVHPVSYPMITENVAAENKGKILGAFGSSSKFGDAAAPAVIGVLVLFLLWDQITFVLGFFGIAYSVLLFLTLRGDEFETTPRRVDGDADSTGRSESVWSGDNRTFLYPIAVIYLFFVSKMFAGKGITTYVPAFIVGVYAYSFEILDVSIAAESVANFYFAALLIFAAAVQLVLGGVTDEYDPRAVMISCVAVATVGLLAFSLLDLSPIALLLVMLVLGGGLWGVNPARDALISQITPPEYEGRTFGYLWTAVQLTASVIPVVVGYLMEYLGMRQGFIVLAVGPILSAVTISLLFSDHVYVRRNHPDGIEASD